MSKWKHNELNNKVNDMFNKKKFDERKEMCLYTANQQLLTIEQTKYKITQQYRELLSGLDKLEDNVAKQIKELLKEREELNK